MGAGPARGRRVRRDARGVALAVLTRVRRTDAYANLVLPAEIRAARLSRRDAALATQLTYGTLRMLGTLDWVISIYSSRPLERIDPQALDALRLGVYQLLYLDTPQYAAVSETVGHVGPAAAGFVNAVLREIARRLGDIPWPAPEGDLASSLRIRHGHPGWVVKMWLDQFGPVQTEELCRANNDFPGIGIRVNTSRISPADLAERLGDTGLDVKPGRWIESALLVSDGGLPSEWPGFAEGLFTIQDESSVLASSIVTGRTIVDLCAGPGGKTTHIAASGARVIACDVHATRAGMVRDAAARLGGRILAVRADGRFPPVRTGVDAVLVDAPCTGLGVLRRRPEARWRVKPEDVARSAQLQSQLLHAALGLLRPGGELVYAVCTVTPAETVELLGGVLESFPEFELVHVLPEIPRPRGFADGMLQLLPHVHGTDGMFIAKLRRNA